MAAQASDLPGENRYASGAYLEQNPDWHEADAFWKAEKIQRMLQRSGMRPLRVCDVGCGSGGVLAELQKMLPPETSLTGFDISPQAMEIAQKKSSSNLQFVHGQPEIEGSNRYDLALAMDVFEHVPDYIGFLNEIRSISSDFIFHIPLDISCLSVLRERPIMRRRNQVGHLHYFIKSTALATLADSKYQIRDWFYTDSGAQVPNRGVKDKIRDIPKYVSFRFFPDLSVRFFGGFSLLVHAASRP